MVKYLKSRHISRDSIRWSIKVTKERLIRGGCLHRMLVLGHPIPWFSSLSQMSGHARIKFVADAAATFDLAICYDHADVRARPAFLNSIPPQVPVINRRLKDIRKSTVQKAFSHCFGYALEVDPLSYAGPIVCKSEANYAHDGRVLVGPLSSDDTREDCVYQKLINSEINENEVMDHRVVITGSVIPLVYLKYRPKASRFASSNNWVEMVETSEVFSDSEQKQIMAFAQHVGLDYGEIDVMRDCRDERIYIVDITGTPGVVPKDLRPDHVDCALERMAWGLRFRLIERLLQGKSSWSYPFLMS